MTVTVIKDLVYGTVHGAGLVADIAFPSDRTALPAVISIHGGRWIRGTRFDDGNEGRPNNGVIDLRQWATAGYFAMRIDYRLVTCTPAPACFQDAMCAIRWIHTHANEYQIDNDRIFLVGQSAGGHLVSLAATLGPDGYERSGGWENARSDFVAAISIAGAYDLIELDWGSGWCPLGVPWDIARAYASPIRHVTAQTRSLMVFHADDDPSVPIAQADAFVGKLAATGVSHQYHRYETGGHLRTTELIYREIQAFIRAVNEQSTAE